jgi:hypothetical protein
MVAGTTSNNANHILRIRNLQTIRYCV